MKRNFNKKKLLTFGILGLFALALVSAIGYYAMFSVSFSVNQPIETSGEVTQTVNCLAGHTCLGTEIIVLNDGTDGEKIVVLSNDNTNLDVKVNYVSELVLSHKSLDDWVAYDTPVTVEYTLVGDTFEVSGVPSGYVAVYYPNVGGDEDEDYTGQVILVDDVDESLPIGIDVNKYSTLNQYCTNGLNPDATQCVGAKIWLVPVDAITYGSYQDIIDWSRANEFYFETSLIQFNTDGNLVISPNSDVTFRPQFEVDEHAIDWSGTITTTVA